MNHTKGNEQGHLDSTMLLIPCWMPTYKKTRSEQAKDLAFC